jgi:hypothetical protein
MAHSLIRFQDFDDLGIQGFRNLGILVSVNLIDRIPIIPKFAIPQLKDG